jgi:hypothetical protein
LEARAVVREARWSRPLRDVSGQRGPRLRGRFRTGWRSTSRKHLYLIDVATTRAGDRSKEGFVVGSSRLAAVRRRHPDLPLGYASDRFALGTRSLTVIRRSSKETFVSLVYWFDARGVLNAFELYTSGC